MSVKPAVTDRQEQLERQILGQLKRLESDLILASSVRGASASQPLSPLAREAAQAAMRRAFNADDIDSFKQATQVGEGRDGALHILAEPSDRAQARWLRELVDQENRARLVLLRRAVQLSPQLSANELPLARHVLYRLLVRTARPGERIQREDGQWITVDRASTP